MSHQISNNKTYLMLLEASQSALESSEKALKAAEEAFNAAKRVNIEAKASLHAATEAFKSVSYKTSENEKQQHDTCLLSVGRNSEQENADPDGAEEDFIMLSTNKKPITDLEDDMSLITPVRSPSSQISAVKQQSPSDPPFFLISSTGPPRPAGHPEHMLGLYQKIEEINEGHSVYIQKHDIKYGANSCKLFSDKGVWRITRDGIERIRAATPSESPYSVKWQYYEYDVWCDDPTVTLTVTGLSEKPSECEVTISLSQDIARYIKNPGVVGVYRANGTYRKGRPVLRNSGGLITLFDAGGCWVVGTGDRGDTYLGSSHAPSQCPADARLRTAARGDLVTHWGYKDKLNRMWDSISGISVKCNKC